MSAISFLLRLYLENCFSYSEIAVRDLNLSCFSKKRYVMVLVAGAITKVIEVFAGFIPPILELQRRHLKWLGLAVPSLSDFVMISEAGFL